MQTDLYYIVFYYSPKKSKLGITPNLWMYLEDKVVVNRGIFSNLHLAHKFNLLEAKQAINKSKAEAPEAVCTYLLVPATSSPIQVIQ